MSKFLLPMAGLLAALVPAQTRIPTPPPASTPPVVQQPTARSWSRVLFDRTDTTTLWAAGRDWKASFDATGCAFHPFFGSDAPRTFPLRIELAAASVGGEPLTLRAGAPRVDGTTVRNDRGTLVETYDTTLANVRQSFVFATLPNRGAIEVDVRLAGDFAASGTSSGVTFVNDFGRVDYHDAVAIDAAGRRLPLAIAWNGTHAHVEIPAAFVASATLPLVLDPIVDVNGSVGTGYAQLQRLPDVATLQNPDRTLIVWQRQFAANDQDCVCEVLDGSLDYVAPAETPIDFSGYNWVEPRVASSKNARNFLIVAQIDDQAGLYYIGGRLVGDDGFAVPNQLVIEGFNTFGLPGNNFRPDVGGDPYPGAQAYYTVVFEHETTPGNRDVYFRQLAQNGTNLTTMPIALGTQAQNETFPAISESNRTDKWLVTWQRTFPAAPFDEDVMAAFVSWDGTVATPAFTLAGSLASERRPSPSSPAQLVSAPGRLFYAMACELPNGAQSDIDVRIVDDLGVVRASFPLSTNEALGAFAARNQILPECESDGARFVVGYSESNGTDYDTLASTLAFVPGTNTVRLDETRVTIAATPGVDDYWTRMSAWFSGNNVASARYVIASGHIAANDIRVVDYGGYAPGAFFSTFPTQCGTLPLNASGDSVLGGTVSFFAGTLAPAGLVVGTPGLFWLGAIGCNCNLGVADAQFVPNGFTLTIPSNPTFVGITLSVQGYAAVGTSCLGFLDLSDTIDFTIR